MTDAASLAPLLAFALASLYTPGPNNLLLATSGARFGFLRTLPHMLGVASGFPVMIFGISMGLGALFQAYPLFGDVLRWVGGGVMLWLAWRIGTASSMGRGDERARPFRYLEAVAFQWINPKAWTMAIGVASVYISGTSPVRDAAVCAGVFFLVGLSSSSIWTGSGAALRRALRRPWALRLFNGTMGLLLAGFVVWMLLDG